jgi:hypothetical protein
MKNVIILLAIIFGFSASYADQLGTTANPLTAENTVTVKVVHPFAVNNIQDGATQTSGGSNTTLPDVILGQNLTVNNILFIFSIQKDAECAATINVSGNNTVKGVTLTGTWYWNSAQPQVNDLGFPAYAGGAFNGSWPWPAETIGADPNVLSWSHDKTLNTYYTTLKVTNIDARHATCDPGETITFTVSVNGYYTSI